MILTPGIYFNKLKFICIKNIFTKLEKLYCL